MNYLLDKEKELLKLNAELDERNKKLSGGESPQKKPGEVTHSEQCSLYLTSTLAAPRGRIPVAKSRGGSRPTSRSASIGRSSLSRERERGGDITGQSESE